MKKIKIISILAFVIAMVSCSGTKMVVDTNDDIDFSKYETYSFQGWQMNSDELLTDENKEIMLDAFVKEFERRGLKLVNVNGNMQVTLYIVTNKKTAYSGYNDYVGRSAAGWGYGYGYGYGGAAYGYGGSGSYGASGNSYKQRDKMMGTLIMSVFKGNTDTQIWQGIYTSAVTNKQKKREKSIPSKVSNLMDKFPVKPIK